MNSSTAGWFRTSWCGTGWITHVMRACGQCRRSALTTGSTCTASPSALSMTMRMLRGAGISSRSATEPLGERPERAVIHPLPVLALELAARAVQSRDHRVAVHGTERAVVEPGAVQVEDAGAGLAR